MAGPLTRAVAAKVRELSKAWPDRAEMGDVEGVLRLLSKWRSQALAQTYVGHHGTTIRAGLFAGMTYLDSATEGSLIARLLGSYEAELHPHLEAMMAEGVECVVDVGCAEGYYAVGLAFRYPTLEVFAHDISEAAQRACAELAARNGASDRVRIGGEFRPQDFEAFSGRRVLVLLDAEGAEGDILDPCLSPALTGMNIIVETHDVWRPGVSATIRERFAATHDIIELRTRPKLFDPPPWVDELSELDLLLATWEWRQRLTPWFVMKPRKAA